MPLMVLCMSSLVFCMPFLHSCLVPLGIFCGGGFVLFSAKCRDSGVNLNDSWNLPHCFNTVNDRLHIMQMLCLLTTYDVELLCRRQRHLYKRHLKRKLFSKYLFLTMAWNSFTCDNPDFAVRSIPDGTTFRVQQSALSNSGVFRTFVSMTSTPRRPNLSISRRYVPMF